MLWVSSARPASARAVSVSSLPKVAGEKDIRVFEARVLAHGRATPFQPVLELLRDYFGLRVKAAADVSRRRVLDRLAALPVSEQLSSVLLEFLGLADPLQPAIKLDPKARKTLLLDFVRTLPRQALRMPTTVVIIEDLHWIDAASEEFVEALADAVVGTTTLLVVNFRPGFAAPLMQRTHYRQINMPPLPRSTSGHLAAGSFWQRPFAGVAEQEHHRARARKSVLPRGACQCTRGTGRF